MSLEVKHILSYGCTTSAELLYIAYPGCFHGFYPSTNVGATPKRIGAKISKCSYIFYLMKERGGLLEEHGRAFWRGLQKIHATYLESNASHPLEGFFRGSEGSYRFVRCSWKKEAGQSLCSTIAPGILGRHKHSKIRHGSLLGLEKHSALRMRRTACLHIERRSKWAGLFVWVRSE